MSMRLGLLLTQMMQPQHHLALLFSILGAKGHPLGVLRHHFLDLVTPGHFQGTTRTAVRSAISLS